MQPKGMRIEIASTATTAPKRFVTRSSTRASFIVGLGPVGFGRRNGRDDSNPLARRSWNHPHREAGDASTGCESRTATGPRPPEFDPCRIGAGLPAVRVG